MTGKVKGNVELLLGNACGCGGGLGHGKDQQAKEEEKAKKGRRILMQAPAFPRRRTV